jgi:ATP phosphoribosyltransferase
VTPIIIKERKIRLKENNKEEGFDGNPILLTEAEHQKVLIVFIVYVPENSGLDYARVKGIEYIAGLETKLRFDVREARGEDIPRIVTESADPALGITGLDLLENVIPNYSNLILSYLNLAYLGPYQNAVFGLPTLCLISRDGKSPDELRKLEVGKTGRLDYELPDLKGKRIVIPQRYERLVRSLIGDDAEFIVKERSVEVTLCLDTQLDCAVDIVSSGNTLEQNNLEIECALHRSDGVVIENSAARELLEPYGL